MIPLPSIRSVSPTLLSTADICLKRAAYYRDPLIPRTSNEASAIGTAYHAALETYYGNEAFIDYDSPSLGEYATPTNVALVEKMVHAHLIADPWPEEHFEVLAVEWPFQIPLGVYGDVVYVLSGVVDLVVRDKRNGQVFLIDHKTSGKGWQKGKETAKQSNQPAIYLYAWWQATGTMGSFVFDVMTYAGKLERRYAPRTSEQIQGAMAKARTMAAFLSRVTWNGEICHDLIPGNTTHFLCSEKWCSYWDICPLGASMQGAA